MHTNNILEKSILAATLFIALVGCTPKYALGISPTSDQLVKYYNGNQFIISPLSDSAVAISPPTYTFKKYGEITILVVNKGKIPFEFDTSNVSVEIQKGQFLHVYSYAELMEEERDRQKWAAIGVALSAASNSMNAANAGTSTSYQSYSGTTYGSYGGTPYSANTYGSGLTTTYDPAKAQAAQALANQQNTANIDSMNTTNRAREADLQSILKRTTIEPGQSYGGVVRFDLPKVSTENGGRALINVIAGPEAHLFLLTVTKTK